MEWLNSHLQWPNAKVIHQSGWRESDWFGTFFPLTVVGITQTLAGFGLQSRKIRFGYFITTLSGCGFIQYFLIFILMKIKLIYFKHDTSSPSGWKIYRFANSLGQITQTFHNLFTRVSILIYPILRS